jgi:hypothetical protein
MKFDSSTRRFYGTPILSNISSDSEGKNQSIQIKLIAKDIGQA